MPKILITGNGFDLNIGLPTGYMDFIRILNYLEGNSNFEFDKIYSNSSNYQKILDSYQKFNFDPSELDLLKNELKTNIWYQFFKNELEIDTWIDFENKIEYVLKVLFSSVDYLKKNVFSEGALSEDRLEYSSKAFNNNIEIIHVLNTFGIIRTNPLNDIILVAKYLIKKYNFYIDIDLDKIASELNGSLINFKSIFNSFFKIFILPFYAKMSMKIDRTLFDNIHKHYTFNYTPTFEKVYKKNNITNFLHGKISSGRNEIVLGINEVPKHSVDDRYFIPFAKYFQKLDNNTDFSFLHDFSKRTSENFIFYFFGHSLDKSDEDYINEVFDFLEMLKSPIKKIVIIYRSDESRSKLLINLLSIRGKNNIVNLMRSKNLEFFNIDSRELKISLNQGIARQTISL